MYQLSWILLSRRAVYYSEFDRRENEAPYIVLITMVLIDAASTDDSNGCHILIWSNLDLGIENPAVGWICKLPAAFLTSFLPDRFNKSRLMALNIRLIDRAAQELSKTLLIAVIVRLEGKILADNGIMVHLS